jgi:hypothetical protein
MGAWGTGIEQNDTTLDVIREFVEQLRKSPSLADATAGVMQAFEHALADPEETAHLRHGLATGQWRYGKLDRALLDAIRADLAAGIGIASYGAQAKAREKVVRAFVAKLSAPNPKPRAMPKPPKVPKRPRVPRPATFEAGDCLALQLPRKGGWLAALVLVRDVTDIGDGFNVVARLDWKDANAPQPRVFGAPDGSAPPKVRAIAMFPGGPFDGNAKVTVVGRVQVDPARFGIEKTPKFWAWRFVDTGKGREGMEYSGWHGLPELRRF